MMKERLIVCLVGSASIIMGCTAISSATPTVTPTLGYVVTNTPVLTAAPTDMRISIETIKTAVAAPGYMSGCGALNPATYQEQVGYQGIYPDRTTRAEVEEILGPPDDIGDNNGYMEYADSSAYIYTEDDIVYLIGIDLESGDVTPDTLGEIIAEYGCPNIIYAYTLSEDPDGNYSMISFVYHVIGLEYEFVYPYYPATKLSLDDTPITLWYIQPGTLDYYLSHSTGGSALQYPNTARLFSWDEIVSR